MKDLAKLTAIFKALGARDPEGWARSEVNEGINQLTRFLFLRAAWKLVVPDRDTKWIDGALRPTTPNAPLSGLAPALERLLAKGTDRADVHEVVRCMQYELLFSLCYLLEDPTWAYEDTGELRPELEKIAWGLFEVDEDGEPGRPIGGLHESVLDTDPSGREMRPLPPTSGTR